MKKTFIFAIFSAFTLSAMDQQDVRDLRITANSNTVTRGGFAGILQVNTLVLNAHDIHIGTLSISSTSQQQINAFSVRTAGQQSYGQDGFDHDQWVENLFLNHENQTLLEHAESGCKLACVYAGIIHGMTNDQKMKHFQMKSELADWIWEGANQNNSQLQQCLSMMLRVGVYYKQNKKQAKYWCKRAADLGNDDAQNDLRKYF